MRVKKEKKFFLVDELTRYELTRRFVFSGKLTSKKIARIPCGRKRTIFFIFCLSPNLFSEGGDRVRDQLVSQFGLDELTVQAGDIRD